MFIKISSFVFFKRMEDAWRLLTMSEFSFYGLIITLTSGAALTAVKKDRNECSLLYFSSKKLFLNLIFCILGF